MELGNIRRKGRRDHAVHLADLLCRSREGEAAGFGNVILPDIPGQCGHIGKPHAGGNLRENIGGHIHQRLRTGGLRLVHGQRQHLPLPRGTVEVRVHETQPSVGHCLHAVQMVHAGMLQLHRAQSRGIHGLGDKGIDIVEFCIADLQIHAAESRDGLGHRRPVEGDVVIDLEIQVVLQRLNSLGMAALEVGLVDLMVVVVPVNTGVGIPVNRAKLHIATPLVHGGHHDHIGKCPGIQISVPGIDAENRDGPVAGAQIRGNEGPGHIADQHRQQQEKHELQEGMLPPAPSSRAAASAAAARALLPRLPGAPRCFLLIRHIVVI